MKEQKKLAKQSQELFYSQKWNASHRYVNQKKRSPENTISIFVAAIIQKVI